jgi:aminoglycoside phosphotransferase (APT) family kinase protein
MSETWNEELGEYLSKRLDTPVEVEQVALIPGGTSKETWTVDAETSEGKLELLILRKTGGEIYSDALSLEQECRVQQTAYDSGIRVPKAYGYFEDLGGREAFVMERLEGEDDGSQVVQDPEFAATREALPRPLAEELARIHSILLERLPCRRSAAHTLTIMVNSFREIYVYSIFECPRRLDNSNRNLRRPAGRPVLLLPRGR